MVNKAALGVLGVIVLVSMGVGVLIGLQLGGGATAGDGTGNGTAGGEGPTPIPVETGGTPTAVPTAGATATSVSPPTETAVQQTTRPLPQRTTVPARRFDRQEIEESVERMIRERRREAGLSEFSIDGQTADRLKSMARRHSDAMADAGRLSHNVDGNTSQDRYRTAGLFDNCQFSSDSDSYLVTAESNDLEVIAQTVAGRPYRQGGQVQFNENETEVARDIANRWWDSIIFRPRLTYENAGSFGVGVEITQDGTVYATGAVC